MHYPFLHSQYNHAPWWASNSPFFWCSHVTWVPIDAHHTRQHVLLPLPISLLLYPYIVARDRRKSVGTIFLCNWGSVRLFIEFLSYVSRHLAASMLQVVNKQLAPILLIYHVSRDYFDLFFIAIVGRCNDPLPSNWNFDVLFCPQLQSGYKLCKCINYLVDTRRDMF